MRIFVLILSYLAFFPCHSEELKFDAFLPKFRNLYAQYHFGSTWPKQKVDKEAARIWNGSHSYYYASITACQGIFETHYNIDQYQKGYRGHMGMRTFTCISEAIRLQIIKKGDKDGYAWLLKTCRKDPAYADKLAGSRLIYLKEHYGTIEEALRTWVAMGGYRGWHEDEDDKKNSLDYYNGVMRLRKIMFGSQK